MRARRESASAGLTELLFDRARVGLCLVGPDGTVLRANAEWLRATGFTAAVIGADVVELFPATRDLALALHARARAGARVEVPRHRQTVNGRETWWEGSIEPVPMDGGTGLLITAREVGAEEGRRAEQHAIVAAIARIFENALSAESEEDLGRVCLAVAEEVTGSAFGFIGELNSPTGRLDAISISDPGWEACRIADAEGRGERRAPAGFVVHGVYGRVLQGGHTVLTNDPRAHPDSIGTPPGHPPLHAFLGVPLLDGGATWGMIAVGNRLGGYGPAERVALEALAPAVMQAFLRKRAERAEREQRAEAQRRAAELQELLEARERSEAALRVGEEEARARAAELATVTRLYAVLTRVNEAIVRTHDQASLLAEVCRIVATSGFPLVWVGLVEGGAVVPAASAGVAVAYLREIRVEVDGPLGAGPTGSCIREGRPVINDDFALNPSTWAWRDATARHGLRASAAFPLHRRGEVIGAVTFYAASAGAFVPEQVQLLDALCADLSYALDALARERLRAEAEESLREADRRKDEFLGMLSHELRNPLAPILNSTHVLRHAAPGSEQAQRAQKVIERQAEHLSRLVDDLLDVTRIARGKIELRRTLVDLREVVSRTVDDARLGMEARGVTFRAELGGGKIWSDADPTRITQILSNLLHNASKFTRGGDEVVLSLEADATEATIRVRDTGAGIEPELLHRIFDPFVQGERTLARTNGGLGLGLALVKGITELHGGTVRANSAGTGKGAEFVVRLPVRGRTTAEAAPDRRAGTTGGGRRVLVVDDNHDAAESLADVVKMLGHAAEVAYDGPTAIEMARANPPDIVLCDLGLPGMSGFEVATALRRGAERLQLFAVSGYAQPEDVRKAIAAGFDGHLAKPLRFDDLERLLT